MPQFDWSGAKEAGYSDAEIADFLAGTQKFDAAAARQGGYSDPEIITYLQKRSIQQDQMAQLREEGRQAQIRSDVLQAYESDKDVPALMRSELGRQVARGFATAAGGVTGLGAILTPGETSQRLLEASRGISGLADIPTTAAQSLGEIKSVGDVPGYVGGLVAQQIPQLLAAGAGAGAVKLAGAGTKLAGFLGPMLTTAPQEAGSIYSDIVEQTGQTGARQRATALGAGIASGALESLGVESALSKRLLREAGSEVADELARRNLRSLLKDVGASTLGEGITEAGQEAVAIGALPTAGGNLPSGSEIAARLAEAGAAGLLTGGVISGAQTGIAAGVDALGERRRENAYQDALNRLAIQSVDRGNAPVAGIYGTPLKESSDITGGPDYYFREGRFFVGPSGTRISNAERRRLEQEALTQAATTEPSVPEEVVTEQRIGQYPTEGFGTGVIPSQQELERRAERRRQVAERNRAEAEARRAEAFGEIAANPQEEARIMAQLVAEEAAARAKAEEDDRRIMAGLEVEQAAAVLGQREAQGAEAASRFGAAPRPVAEAPREQLGMSPDVLQRLRLLRQQEEAAAQAAQQPTQQVSEETVQVPEARQPVVQEGGQGAQGVGRVDRPTEVRQGAVPADVAGGAQVADAAPASQKDVTKPLKLFVDGVEGQTVPFSQVPNGNPAFEYALGTVEQGGVPAVYRRKISESGTYGGWRWETDAGKISSPTAAAPQVAPATTLLYGDSTEIAPNDTVEISGKAFGPEVSKVLHKARIRGAATRNQDGSISIRVTDAGISEKRGRSADAPVPRVQQAGFALNDTITFRSLPSGLVRVERRNAQGQESAPAVEIRPTKGLFSKVERVVQEAPAVDAQTSTILESIFGAVEDPRFARFSELFDKVIFKKATKEEATEFEALDKSLKPAESTLLRAAYYRQVGPQQMRLMVDNLLTQAGLVVDYTDIQNAWDKEVASWVSKRMTRSGSKTNFALRKAQNETVIDLIRKAQGRGPVASSTVPEDAETSPIPEPASGMGPAAAPTARTTDIGEASASQASAEEALLNADAFSALGEDVRNLELSRRGQRITDDELVQILTRALRKYNPDRFDALRASNTQIEKSIVNVQEKVKAIYKQGGSKILIELADAYDRGDPDVISLLSRPWSAPTGLSVAGVQSHLALRYGIRPDSGMVGVISIPGADFNGRLLTLRSTGQPIGIQINAATVSSLAEVDKVLQHELAEMALAQGVARDVLSQISAAELAEIRATVAELGYDPSNDTEVDARIVEQLVAAYRNRNWFQRVVANVLAWANSKGLKITRLAAELIAARAVAAAQADVVSGTTNYNLGEYSISAILQPTYAAASNVQSAISRESKAKALTPEQKNRLSEAAGTIKPNRSYWVLPDGAVVDVAEEGYNEEGTAFSHGIYVKNWIDFRTKRFFPNKEEVAVAEAIQKRAREIVKDDPSLEQASEDGGENAFAGDLAYNQAAEEYGWVRVKPMTVPTGDPVVYAETISGNTSRPVTYILNQLRERGMKVDVLAGGALANRPGLVRRQQQAQQIGQSWRDFRDYGASGMSFMVDDDVDIRESRKRGSISAAPTAATQQNLDPSRFSVSLADMLRSIGIKQAAGSKLRHVRSKEGISFLRLFEGQTAIATVQRPGSEAQDVVGEDIEGAPVFDAFKTPARKFRVPVTIKSDPETENFTGQIVVRPIGPLPSELTQDGTRSYQSGDESFAFSDQNLGFPENADWIISPEDITLFRPDTSRLLSSQSALDRKYGNLVDFFYDGNPGAYSALVEFIYDSAREAGLDFNELYDAAFPFGQLVPFDKNGQAIPLSKRFDDFGPISFSLSRTTFTKREKVADELGQPGLLPDQQDIIESSAAAQAAVVPASIKATITAAGLSPRSRTALSWLGKVFDLSASPKPLSSLNPDDTNTMQIASAVMGQVDRVRKNRSDLILKLEKLREQMLSPRRAQILSELATANAAASAAGAASSGLTKDFRAYNRQEILTYAGTDASLKNAVTRASDAIRLLYTESKEINKAFEVMAENVPDAVIAQAKTLGNNQPIFDYVINSKMLDGKVSKSVIDALTVAPAAGKLAPLQSYRGLASALRTIKDYTADVSKAKADRKAFEALFAATSPSTTAKAKRVDIEDYARRYRALRNAEQDAVDRIRSLSREIEALDNALLDTIEQIGVLDSVMGSAEYTDSANTASNLLNLFAPEILGAPDPNGVRHVVGGTPYVIPSKFDPETDRDAAGRVLSLSNAVNARLSQIASGTEPVDPVERRTLEHLRLKLQQFAGNTAGNAALRIGPFNPARLRRKIPILRSLISRRHLARIIPGRLSGELNMLNAAGDSLEKALDGQARRDKTVGVNALNVATSRALASHPGMDPLVWKAEVLNEILNANQKDTDFRVTAGMTTPFGHTVTKEDIDAAKLQARFGHKVYSVSTAKDRGGVLRFFPNMIMEGNRLRLPFVTGAMTTPRRLVRDEVEGGPVYYAKQIEQALENPDEASRKAEIERILNEPNAFTLMARRYVWETNSEFKNRSPYAKIYRKLAVDWWTNKTAAPTNLDELVDQIAAFVPGTANTQQEVRDSLINEIVAVSKASLESQRTSIQEAGEYVKNGVGDEGFSAEVFSPSAVVSVVDSFNQFTKPRGDMVAPGSFYDYTLATDESQNALIVAAMMPLRIRQLRALMDLQRELMKHKTNLAQRMNLNPQSVKQDLKNGKLYLELSEVSELLQVLSDALETFKGRVSAPNIAVDNGLLRAWNAVHKALLVNALTAATGNILFGIAGGDTAARVMTRGYTPRTGISTLAAGPRVLLNIVERAFANNPDAVRFIKKNRSKLGALGARMMRQAELYAEIEAAARRGGWRVDEETAAERAAQVAEVGGFRSPIRSRGELRDSLLNRIERKLSKRAIVRVKEALFRFQPAGDEVANDLNAKTALTNLTLLFQAGYNIIKNRAASGVPNWDNWTDPNNFIRPEEAKQVAGWSPEILFWLKENMAPAGSLEYLLHDYYKRVEAAKAAGTDPEAVAPLADEDALADVMIRILSASNLPADSSRADLIRSSSGMGQALSFFWGFPGWINNWLDSLEGFSSISSERRSQLERLAMPVIYTMALTALLALSGLWPNELLALFYELVNGRPYNVMTAREFASAPTPAALGKLMAVSLARMVPYAGEYIAGYVGATQNKPSMTDLSKMSIPLGVLANFSNALETAWKTGDIAGAALGLTRSTLPILNPIVNRIAPQGRDAINDAVRVATRNAGDLEIKTRPGGGGGFEPTEFSSLIKRAVAANANGDAAGAKALLQRAADVKAKSGVADPWSAVKSSLKAQAPDFKTFGRTISDGERAGLLGRMSANQRDVYQTAENAVSSLLSGIGTKAERDAASGGVAGLVAAQRQIRAITGTPKPIKAIRKQLRAAMPKGLKLKRSRGTRLGGTKLRLPKGTSVASLSSSRLLRQGPRPTVALGRAYREQRRRGAAGLPLGPMTYGGMPSVARGY